MCELVIKLRYSDYRDDSICFINYRDLSFRIPVPYRNGSEAQNNCVNRAYCGKLESNYINISFVLMAVRISLKTIVSRRSAAAGMTTITNTPSAADRELR